MDHAGAFRTAAATDIASFAVRRVFEAAELLTADITAHLEFGLVRMKALHQKNTFFFVLVAIDAMP